MGRVPSRQRLHGGGGANVELQPLGADPEGHAERGASDAGPKAAEIYAQYGITTTGGGVAGGGGSAPARACAACWAYLHAEGGWVMASFHIITAIIGAGVLGLPHALSVLGAPGGVLALVAFFAVTLWCSCMLADMHEVDGVRHATYGGAVVHVLGRGSAAAVLVCQVLNLVLSGIGYTVAAGESLKMVLFSGCAADDPACGGPVWRTSLAFGAFQLLASQLPSLEAAWWASAVGAAMSVLYSTAAFGMAAARADPRRVTAAGRPLPPRDKAFAAFSALGSVAFAYSFSAVLLEVQDTLREPPPAARTMRKAILASLVTTFVAYVGVGFAGYAALGDATPGNILTGFTSPAAVVTLANAAVLVHMVPAYQVFSQPVFFMIEGTLAARVPALRGGIGWPLRAALRSAYVVCTTAVAVAMPFFADIIGLIGALIFWPSTIYFPVRMAMRVRSPPRWQRALMHATNLVGAVVSLLAAVGSAWAIARDASKYKLFGG